MKKKFVFLLGISIVLAIKDQLQIPVRYIGLGEGVDDLMEFDLEAYLNGLVGITVEEE